MLTSMIVGEMICQHDGIRCYPAIKRGTEEKYILKIISIPASASKLEALLLTGALPNQQAAKAYFKDLAKDVIKQAALLQELSQQEGFVSYLDSQIVPAEDKIGYEVYLLGKYKQSLEAILQTEALTHADILNMALDLCAALAASRRAGMLYVDLKPGNIFRDPQAGCCIGDVGFIGLSSLKYATIPDKYRSSYTAPELADDFAVLNETVDIYALGLVLYQAYNGGVLPYTGAANVEELPSPMYADYEMAKIIGKACHPDPSQRWQDPTQLAQALIGYMQAYGAPETPVIPTVVEIAETEEPVEEFLPEADAQQLQAEMDALQEESPELAFLPQQAEAAQEHADEVSEDMAAEDLDLILARADELIAHELPQPPVVPEPIAIPTPEPIAPEFEEVAEDVPEETEIAQKLPEEAAAPKQPESCCEAQEDAQEATPVPAPKQAQTEGKKRFIFPKGLVVALLLILLAIGIGSYAKHYYDDIYTLHIESIALENTLDTLTVQIVTDADESLLQVICADSYGNSQTAAVVGGKAQFTQLKPNTRYTVRIISDEAHRVTGYITDTFTTPAQTVIHSFFVGIGPEDCSAVLHFTVSGPDTNNWIVRYSAPGIAEQSQQFSGHSTIIFGLTEGAMYTFTLEPDTDLYMAGATQTEYLATNILYARELQITACAGGSLTVQWQQPENGSVSQWQVRCYNRDGYDVTVTTEDCSYTFTELTHDSACTVEVTAVGMNRSVSTSVPANPITIQDFTCTVTDEMGLHISWNYAGHTPEGGWRIRYSINGDEVEEIATEETSLTLRLLPQSSYNFSILAADGSYLFQSEHSFQTSELAYFNDLAIDAQALQTWMFLWNSEAVWDWADVSTDAYRISFTYGETAGLILIAENAAEKSDLAVNVQFVLVGADQVPVRMDTATMIWNGMWQDNLCCLALPYLPEVPGSYSLILYFNGQFVCQQDFTIV